MIENVKTLEKDYKNIRVTVTNFPYFQCGDCGESETLLTDGVMVDLYARELTKAEIIGNIVVDFKDIKKVFVEKNLEEELFK